jgi:hypothetical protein
MIIRGENTYYSLERILSPISYIAQFISGASIPKARNSMRIFVGFIQRNNDRLILSKKLSCFSQKLKCQGFLLEEKEEEAIFTKSSHSIQPSALNRLSFYIIVTLLKHKHDKGSIRFLNDESD